MPHAWGRLMTPVGYRKSRPRRCRGRFASSQRKSRSILGWISSRSSEAVDVLDPMRIGGTWVYPGRWYAQGANVQALQKPRRYSLHLTIRVVHRRSILRPGPEHRPPPGANDKGSGFCKIDAWVGGVAWIMIWCTLALVRRCTRDLEFRATFSWRRSGPRRPLV